MSTLLTLQSASEAHGVHLPMPAWGFGVLALVVLLALLLFVWMFRHTAQAMIEGDHAGHGVHPGHGAQGAHGVHPGEGRRH